MIIHERESVYERRERTSNSYPSNLLPKGGKCLVGDLLE